LSLSFSIPNPAELWDLGSFVLAGWSERNGLPPYDWDARETFGTIHGVTMTGPNVNSPVSLFFFILLPLIPIPLLVYGWYGAQLLSMGFILFWLWKRYIHSRAISLNPTLQVCAVLSLAALSGFWYS